jgi:group I intron endonuclease
MTVGIYTLTFDGLDDWPYVGQSQNIEERYVAHKSSIKLGNSNYKLLEAFDIAGKKYPQLTILEVCENTDILDSREVYWINKLDSINNGLNITDRVINKAYGEDNFNAKFSNETIESAFLFICDNLNLSNKQLAQITNVTESVVCSLILGSTHLWLHKKYPDKLLINKNIKRTNSAKKLGIEYPKIRSPEGEIFQVDNLSEFARKYELNKSSLHQVLTGKRKSCSKWKLA